MSTLFHLRTPRLLLRHWCADDYVPFAALNGDREVMRYFPAPLSRDESDALANRIAEKIDRHGWGFWAVELLQNQRFIGFVGLNHNADTPRGEIVEIGWRLQSASWGQGYATEAAKAALVFAFTMLKLAEVYAFTTTTNLKSQAVMERLGLEDCRENFMHPKVPVTSSLREHVLYRIAAPWFTTDMPIEIEAMHGPMGN